MSARLKLSAAAMLTVIAAPAWAQDAPNANLDDRFRLQSQPQTERERTDALMTGDTDLVLLQRRRLFSIGTTVGVSPTSNAFLSPDGEQSDIIFQLQSALRVGTRIAERVDIFAEAGVLGVRYEKFSPLGYSALTGGVGLATQLAGIDIALAYQPSIIYSRNFGTRQLTQHQFSASVARPFVVGRVIVTPSLTGQRVESSPSDYRNWAGSAELAVSHNFRIGRLPAAVYASGGYERRVYDSYFPDLLGVDRKDGQLRASVGLIAQLAPFASLRAAYNFQRTRSTSDVNGYTAHSGALSLSAAIRF